MNVKEYISSGIVESYVLGLATEAERQEFEALCLQYPEVAAARQSFEVSLETQLLQDAVPPPPLVKTALMQKIRGDQEAALTATPSQSPVRSINPWKWVAAASLLLLAGALVWAIGLNNRNQELQARNRSIEQDLQRSGEQLQALNKDAELLQKPGMKMAAMTGTADPSVYSTIFWDTASKDVYLMINNLPQPATGKQYQLWALLDGKPIDLGMIEVKQERLLYRMKGVQEAQAFAITLEQKGGSPVPTSAPVALSKL